MAPARGAEKGYFVRRGVPCRERTTLSLTDRQFPVNAGYLKTFAGPVRPKHFDRVDPVGIPQSNVDPRVVTADVTVTAKNDPPLLPISRDDRHLGADGVPGAR